MELWLTDSLLATGEALYRGQVDPVVVDPSWHIERPAFQPLRLIAALEQGESVVDALDALIPMHEHYRALRKALKAYRAVAQAGGWPWLPPGPDLEAGSRDLRVIALRRRLQLSGDLARSEVDEPELYDPTVAQAIERFQRRHGLAADGVVGPQTRELLNVPVEVWIRKLRMSLERWRWMPRDLGARYILVNVPSFELELFDAQAHQPLLDMRVIVGRTDRRTPSLASEVTQLVINPAWYIPQRIAREDILPQLVGDSGYLERRNIRIVSLNGEPTPSAEEAARLVREGQPFPYTLVQDPGPDNALGSIKFRLPNNFSIYLHDTPTQWLFEQDVRAFSSGCVRLQQPLALAEVLLRQEEAWGNGRLRTTIDSGRREVVPLSQPIPIYITYMTAWVDAEGRPNFREDLYRRDTALAQAMFGSATLR